MKRIIYILFAATLILSSCSTTKQLNQVSLQQDRMEHRLDSMQQQLNAMQQQLSSLNQKMSSITGAHTPSAPSTSTTTPATKADWSTCVMRGAKAKVSMGGKSYTSACATQAIWDSIVVISITPVFGIEIFRIEATPHDITIINKNDKEYYQATYAEINAVARPFVTYADLRSVASGKTPSTAKNGVLTYSAKNSSASLQMTYSTPVFNKPLNIQRLDLKKYTKKDIHKLLK